MNLFNVSSHTVDMDLLPIACTVLDVGSRNFGFTKAILEHRPAARVVCIEPDPTIELTAPNDMRTWRVALVGDKLLNESNYAAFSTGEGNFLCDKAPAYAVKHRVKTCDIESVMRWEGVQAWDLIKLDCEGSEFGILENWPGPHIAQQISVEFHDYTDLKRWDDRYFSGLFSQAGPLHGYRVVQHELTGVGPGPSYGHWDTLLVRK